MGSLLQLRDITVVAAGRTILSVGGLDLADDETLAVVGPTGAGKSTLLRVLAGLEQPASGEVRWRGEPVRTPWPLALRRRVAMAFQQPLLFRGTVRDNVGYGLRLRGVARGAARRSVDAILERFGIGALAARAAHTLSGGEAQRVSLARAVVVRPELLLLDEPFASLDQQTRERLRDELRAIIGDMGICCVHVTHDQAEARIMGDRMGVVADGALLQAGPTDEVFFRPATLRVARLLGAENLWPAEVLGRRSASRAPSDRADGAAGLDDEEAAEVELAVGPIRLWARAPAIRDLGARVTLCIRAEDVELATVDDDARTSAAPTRQLGAAVVGVVRSSKPAGPVHQLQIDCGTGVELVALVTRRAAHGLAYEPGRRVVASIAAEALHLVPADCSS